MDDLIKLVRTYRMTGGLAERVRLAENIFRIIQPDLRFFVFGNIPHQAAEDVMQEVLKGIATSLKQFKGDTVKEFWGWCYRIARNKMNDHYREKASERVHHMPPEDLWQIMESSGPGAPMSIEVRHDLEYALKLLTAAKPECNELLWQHYVIGMDYTDLAEERGMSYDSVRMKIGRCMEEAKSLVS